MGKAGEEDEVGSKEIMQPEEEDCGRGIDPDREGSNSRDDTGAESCRLVTGERRCRARRRHGGRGRRRRAASSRGACESD